MSALHTDIEAIREQIKKTLQTLKDDNPSKKPSTTTTPTVSDTVSSTLVEVDQTINKTQGELLKIAFGGEKKEVNVGGTVFKLSCMFIVGVVSVFMC